MKSILSKKILASVIVASSLSLPAIGQAAGNTCVYVLGNVSGYSVTTPALMVVVPETIVNLGPLRVQVDPTYQNVVGYHVATPELDAAAPGQSLYVPGLQRTIPSYSATIHDVNIAHKTCVSFGVTTPAVPVHVPASALAVPGAVVETPEITLNALGVSKTVRGKVITVAGQTIVVPGLDAVVPSVTANTPDKTIAVYFNQRVYPAKVMNLP
ncbi:MAG TPA: hypothetical protein VEC06_07685 [Paucimonas sp.]|nr:hypothetical protein [Paucimonas sp.]